MGASGAAWDRFRNELVHRWYIETQNLPTKHALLLRIKSRCLTLRIHENATRGSFKDPFAANATVRGRKTPKSPSRPHSSASAPSLPVPATRSQDVVVGSGWPAPEGWERRGCCEGQTWGSFNPTKLDQRN